MLLAHPAWAGVVRRRLRTPLTEIARRKRRGFSPSREAGFSGLSPCFWPAGRVHSFQRQGVFLRALSGRPGS